MAIALVKSQFGPTSTQNPRKMTFLPFLLRFFLKFFVLLAGNLVLYQCHSIAHVLPLYFLCKADLLDLTRWDKMDPGQKGSRTKWIQDKMEPGQKGSRTKGIQDKMDPGQKGTRTKWIQDNLDPGPSGSRTIWIQDNMDPGQYASGTIGRTVGTIGPLHTIFILFESIFAKCPRLCIFKNIRKLK